MSGFLEQLKADVDGHTQQIAQIVAAIQALQAAPAPVAAPAQAAPAATIGLGIGTAPVAAAPLGGGLGIGTAPVAPAAAPTNVTGDDVMALITPHVDNAQIKEALGAQMRAMGIEALPQAQPHQYPELYQRFQQVLAQFGAGQAPAPAAAAASII